MKSESIGSNRTQLEWEHGAANEFSSYQSANIKLPTGLATDLLSSIREIDQKKEGLEELNVRTSKNK